MVEIFRRERSDGRSALQPRKELSGDNECEKIIHNIKETQDFYVKTQIGKKPQEGGDPL